MVRTASGCDEPAGARHDEGDKNYEENLEGIHEEDSTSGPCPPRKRLPQLAATVWTADSPFGEASPATESSLRTTADDPPGSMVTP